MNKWRRLGSIVPYLSSLFACCASAVAQDVQIEHVTVVSPERPRPLTNVTVVIRGDRIASMSSSAPARAAGFIMGYFASRVGVRGIIFGESKVAGQAGHVLEHRQSEWRGARA